MCLDLARGKLVNDVSDQIGHGNIAPRSQARDCARARLTETGVTQRGNREISIVGCVTPGSKTIPRTKTVNAVKRLIDPTATLKCWPVCVVV